MKINCADDGIFVANSYTKELFPVDKTVIYNIIKNKDKSARQVLLTHGQDYCKLYISNNRFNQSGYWSNRCETIYQLILAGF